jgi:hypothetical protein
LKVSRASIASAARSRGSTFSAVATMRSAID